MQWLLEMVQFHDYYAQVRNQDLDMVGGQYNRAFRVKLDAK
jgi:hypothetical protein